jgi:hypothetical protein
VKAISGALVHRGADIGRGAPADAGRRRHRLHADAGHRRHCLHFAANTAWARRQGDGTESDAGPVRSQESDAAHADGGPEPGEPTESVRHQLPVADSVPPWKTEEGGDAEAVWWKSHADTQLHRTDGDLALTALRLAGSGMSGALPFQGVRGDERWGVRQV